MIPAGNPLNFTVTFRDENGNPVDPASGILVWVETPDGTQTSYADPAAVTRLATGVYRATVEGSEAGTYYGQGEGVLSNGMKVTSEVVSETLAGSRFPS